MKLALCLVLALIAHTKAASLQVVSQENVPSAPLPETGAAVDEVRVESSLYIKPKSQPVARRTRRSVASIVPDLISLVEHRRVKRVPQHGQSQAAANAAANAQHQSPFGSGNSAANAQSQAFNAFGPSGSFGATSAGTVTQAHNNGPLGSQNSAGASMSQSYKLPNGQSINFASTNSFANGGLGNNANSRGGAVSVTG